MTACDRRPLPTIAWQWVCWSALILPSAMPAQEPNLTEMDGNEDGVIQPEEIPSQSLAVISRYASLAGGSVSQPTPISVLERGRAKYFESLVAGHVPPTPAARHEFGRAPVTRMRGFGTVGELADTFTNDVHEQAVSIFQRFDTNRDAILSLDELSYLYRSTARTWMSGDRDGNRLLTFPELVASMAADSQRRQIARAHERSTWNVDGVAITYRHRRHAAQEMNRLDRNENGRLDRDEIPTAWKNADGRAWADANGDGQISTTEMQTASVRLLRQNELSRQQKTDADLPHCASLATDILRRFDLNKDQMLSDSEWRRLAGAAIEADFDHSGSTSKEELVRWLLSRLSSQPGANLPTDVPAWLLEADADLDGQVTMSEFLRTQSADDVSDFSHLDRNADGIVTPHEARHRASLGKVRYANQSPRILEEDQEVHSEIYVQDPMRIADIDVEISILKEGDDDLEVRLRGPDGTEAMLYYTSARKPWGGGFLFDGTIIDDEAPRQRQRLPRPPANRSFRPQSVDHPRLLSLAAFYGKPAKGTWRLIIANKGRNRGRTGLLEGWALLVKRKS